MKGLIQQSKSGSLPPEMQSVIDKAAGAVKNQELLKRFVIAGQRYMFQPKAAKAMLKGLGESGDILREVGTGIAGMVLIISERSGSKELTADVVMAGAVELLMHALDALQRGGYIKEPIGMEQISQACEAMIEKLMELLKLDDKVITGIADKAQPMMDDPQHGPAIRAKMQEMQNGTT